MILFGFRKRERASADAAPSSSEVTRIRSVAKSETGLVRADNQDHLFVDDERLVYCVADGVGGGAEGSAVLGGFRDDFEKCGYDMYYVFNANRPENTDTESALLSLKEIEISSGMHFTGIINNTHMCGETDQKTIEKGVAQATEFASAAGRPLLATTAFHSYLPGVSVMQDVTKKFF